MSETTTTETPPETEQEAPPELDATALAAELKTARAQAAQYRSQAKRHEDALKEIQQSQMSEQEKLVARNKELEAAVADRDKQLSQVALQSSVLSAAARLGFRDPDDAVALLMRDTSSLTLDENGKATNLDEVLGALLTAKPHLAGKAANNGSSDPGQRGRPADASNFDAMLRSASGRG